MKTTRNLEPGTQTVIATTLSKLICFHSEKWSTLKGKKKKKKKKKKLRRGLTCSGAKRKSQKLFPSAKIAENLLSVSSPLKTSMLKSYFSDFR